MNWLGTAFNGFPVEAIDGAVGDLADILFDDKTWHIRWLVVDTGRWLNGRRVLIHPSALCPLETCASSLRVRLARKQLRDSPPIDSDTQISAQMERSLNFYYGYDLDCADAWRRRDPDLPQPGRGTRPNDGSLTGKPARSRQKSAEPHLRSVAEVEGYMVCATDGDAGFLKNVVIDDEAWCVHNLVVDVPHWWILKHVVVSTAMVERLSWSERCIRLAMTRDKIKGSLPLRQTGMTDSALEVLLRAYHAWKTQTPRAAGGE